MINKMKTRSLFLMAMLTLLVGVAFVFNACNKKFDEPAVMVDPKLTANRTIKELKALHIAANGSIEEITEDIIISGVVIANDRSGNLFKEIYLQDASGAINLKLEANSLYNNYPLGRRVFVKCKGLAITDYRGLIQLGIKAFTIPGTPSVEGILPSAIDNYVVRGSLNNAFAPKVVTSLADLKTDMQNELLGNLIQLNNVEVIRDDLKKTFSDTSNYKQAGELRIENCSKDISLIIRSSGYANFAAMKPAKGNGTLLAIYTIFNSGSNSNRQLIIRDTSDMKFNNLRCDGTNGDYNGITTLITIADVKALYTGATVSAPGSRKVTGVVISDRAAANLVAPNLVLQQGNGLPGIIIRYKASSHSFNLGDSLDIDITGGTIEKFSGALQINNLDISGTTVVSSGKTITPRAVTNTQLNASIDAWESTLVRVSNVTISGGTSGTWSGNTIINDGTATVTHFTRNGTNGATFQTTPYPTGTVTSITGIAGKFTSGTTSTNQITIRNLTDVVGGTSGGGASTLLNEDFEATTANTDIALTGWFNGAETGTQKYQSKAFGGDKYAQISAFSTNEAVVSSWLVTKGINLNATTGEVLTFDSKAGFANGATLKVLVSTNYSGTGNPWATGVTWTDITSSATLSPGLSSGFPTNFTASGNISLSSYTGTIYVAFKYEGVDAAGTASDKTTTWQIDDIKIVGN